MVKSKLQKVKEFVEVENVVVEVVEVVVVGLEVTGGQLGGGQDVVGVEWQFNPKRPFLSSLTRKHNCNFKL